MFLLKVDIQTWVIVNLQNPSLKLMIDKQVEAQNLERLSANLSIVRHLGDLMLDKGSIHLHSLSACFSDVLLNRFDINLSLL